ncbi:MAG: transglutaminase domain-containing protein [Candidatus Methanodesulfokora sp.]
MCEILGCCKIKASVDAVCRWIRDNIAFDPEARNFHPCDILRERKGTCLSALILATSLLRSLGFEEDKVFTIVAQGEDPFEATHASLLLFPDGMRMENRAFIISILPEHIFISTTLNEFLLTNTIITIFNDKVAYIPK